MYKAVPPNRRRERRIARLDSQQPEKKAASCAVFADLVDGLFFEELPELGQNPGQDSNRHSDDVRGCHGV